MNINVIALILWLIAGILNAISTLQKQECRWLNYWLVYACLISALVTKVIG